MFWVFKSFSRIRGIQRTSNQMHTTHRKKMARSKSLLYGFLIFFKNWPLEAIEYSSLCGFQRVLTNFKVLYKIVYSTSNHVLGI